MQKAPPIIQRRRKEILPGEGGGGLLKCIDPNEGEALRKGGGIPPITWGGGLKDIPAPPHLPRPPFRSLCIRLIF